MAMMPTVSPFCVWYVGADELDARLLETKEEVRVSGQTIELCDNQRGGMQLT